MFKSIGILLIVTSVLAIASGAFIDFRYNGESGITGQAIASELKTGMGLYDYIGALILSYAMVSFIMGMAFILRA